MVYYKCMYFFLAPERKVRCRSKENMCFTYNDEQVK